MWKGIWVFVVIFKKIMRQIQNKLVDNTTKTRIGPADTASKK